MSRYMAGSEGTGEYAVFVDARRGRLGVRKLSGGRYRVRIEPSSEAAASELASAFPQPMWKQPGDDNQDRYSTVVDRNDLVPVAMQAMKALLKGQGISGLTAVFPAVEVITTSLLRRAGVRH